MRSRTPKSVTFPTILFNSTSLVPLRSIVYWPIAVAVDIIRTAPNDRTRHRVRFCFLFFLEWRYCPVPARAGIISNNGPIGEKHSPISAIAGGGASESAIDSFKMFNASSMEKHIRVTENDWIMFFISFTERLSSDTRAEGPSCLWRFVGLSLHFFRMGNSTMKVSSCFPSSCGPSKAKSITQ